MDVADIASDLEDRERQMALLRIREQHAQGPGRVECEDCGDPIPEARRTALPGVTRCRDCQEEWERNRQQALPGR